MTYKIKNDIHSERMYELDKGIRFLLEGNEKEMTEYKNFLKIISGRMKSKNMLLSTASLLIASYYSSVLNESAKISSIEDSLQDSYNFSKKQCNNRGLSVGDNLVDILKAQEKENASFLNNIEDEIKHYSKE